MADISKITLPDNSSYDIKDATARSKLNVLANNMATCATGRATAAKVATLANFSLNVGATIAVKFTDTAGTANPTSGNLTLNVNSTGAKTIGYFKNGSKAALNYSSAAYFYNNSTHIFTYDGTYWLCMDWNADANTDTKVTSVANHYTPAKSTTKSASGGTLTDITNSTSGTQVVTGVEMDAKGHVTGVTSVALKSTDTKVTVDSILDITSTNPVQNKAICTALAGKAASSHTHSDYASKSLYGDTTINVGRKAETTVGAWSTAEGVNTTASGTNGSHAEGANTTASGGSSHAEGYGTTASGEYGSHAEGWNTSATGKSSSAHGYQTQALHDYEAAFGKYNVSNNDTLFSIGDGTSDDARHNAFEITTTGGKLHNKDIATTDVIHASSLFCQRVTPSSKDCNDCTEVGAYFFNGCLANAPTSNGVLNSGTYFILESVMNNAAVIQTATFTHGAYLGKKFSRHLDMTSNSWSAWGEIMKNQYATGLISGLSNGSAVTVSLKFAPVAVLFFDSTYIKPVSSGFSVSLGTGTFTITPSSVSAMGTTGVRYLAFGG